MRLVSAGPLFFFRLLLGLSAALAGACAQAPRSRVEMFPGIVVQPSSGVVELDARVACRRGFLEQVVCTKGTREHESLFVVSARPSQIQAALLAVGMQPGRPGRWQRRPDGSIERDAPTGDAIEVLVRPAEGAEPIPVDRWVRDERGAANDRLAFVFAGSSFVPARGGGERFLADDSGSVVGLVTFGDEVIALADVVPDRVDAEPARWQARTAAVPAEGTAVTLVIRARP